MGNDIAEVGERVDGMVTRDNYSYVSDVQDHHVRVGFSLLNYVRLIIA